MPRPALFHTCLSCGSFRLNKQINLSRAEEGHR